MYIGSMDGWVIFRQWIGENEKMWGKVSGRKKNHRDVEPDFNQCLPGDSIRDL